MRFFSLLVLTFCGFARADVLATVGGTPITSEEFQRRYEELRKQSNNVPSPELFLQELIHYKLGLAEANKRELRNDPLVKERIDQVLYNTLLEKDLGTKAEQIKVTEPEIKEFYKKSPELHVAHILIAAPPEGSPADREMARARAQVAYDELKKSKKPFEEVARLNSDDTTSKETGGDLGFQSRLTLPGLLYDAAAKLKPGEVKGVIESKFGFHIVKLIEKRPYDLADKRQVRAAVLEEKRSKMLTEYFEKMKKTYKVDVNKEALKALTL